MRHIARQPILNLRGHVHGYELLFRHARDTTPNSELAAEPSALEAAGKPQNPAADAAARTMLDNAVLFGLEWLTNGLPAFVRCTLETLSEDLVSVLAPARTVLEIPGNLQFDPRLLDTCRKLKARGFRLALEDFNWSVEWSPLAKLADYIRVDFNRFAAAERRYLQNLDAAPAMVATNVDTQDDYEKARADGFTFFQGSYFYRPVLLKKRTLPANRLLHFDIVRSLHHDPIDVRHVSRLVQRDASLTYRLLRFVNSPLYPRQQEIRSIEMAIMIAGENAFRRMVSLAVLSEIGNEAPPEILHMTLVRARFCELTADLFGLDAAEQYLLGMLSLVPAMLRLPMEEVTPSLPLRAEICDALQGVQSRERRMLSWLESYEQGDWGACDTIAPANDAARARILRCYEESVVWAATALQSSAS
jgi:EAL and modified HD-GYP domain-containing signal transduction protein